MSLKDGTYMIYSVNPGSGHLDLSPIMVPIEPPFYIIIGSLHKDWKEQWKVTSNGDGTYQIHSTTHPRAVWALKEQSGAIIASERDKPSEFSIESAGEDIWRIHIPNKDQVATLKSADLKEQLHVEKDSGHDYQRWKFVSCV